jgi:hypothetical protein
LDLFELRLQVKALASLVNPHISMYRNILFDVHTVINRPGQAKRFRSANEAELPHMHYELKTVPLNVKLRFIFGW